MLTYFSRINENLVKIDENLVKNVNKNSWISSELHKTLNLILFFHILRWTGFLMILLTTLYDCFIDRPKLSERKKLIWAYSSSPPQEGSEQ